jgi:hypothetical protein
MQNTKKLIGSAILLLLVMAGCGKKSEVEQAAPANFSVEDKAVNKEKSTYFKKADGQLDTLTAKAYIKVSYPQLTGWANANAQTTLNSLIQAQIDTLLANFKRQGGIDATAPDKNDTLTMAKNEQPMMASYSSSLDVKAGVNQKFEQYVSVSIESNMYLGGANGMAARNILNFDPKAGKVIALADLFAAPDHLQKIADMCRADLTARKNDMGSDDKMIADGTAPQADLFDCFELSAEGLRIYFQPMQVAPNASGEQSVLLGFDKIAPLLKENSLALAFKKPE